jgi:hypothetical protein
MKQKEIRYEDVVGRAVRNQYGRPIGLIADLRVEPDGEDYLVTEFLLGPLELLPRLRAFVGELPTFRTLGIGQEARLRRIPWCWIDLSDPERPRLALLHGEGGQV